MQQNAFVQSMKTIAQSVIKKAGFDKTRNGQIVGVNTVTNTYSVKVDGVVYNNVKVANGMEYNVGDIVKINIPMNNPSQAYISSSVLSDDSIGNKLGNAFSLIDDTNDRIDSVIEIMGQIYQLSVGVAYENYIDEEDNKQYVRNTYTAILTQDGVDVTNQHAATEFEWYLEKTTGRTVISSLPTRSITLSTKDYLYGQSVMLEWTYTYTDEITHEEKTVQLRTRVTLFDNGTIENVAKYTTEITNGGVFVHRADGDYDVGADYESVHAYGVKIADTVDIIKAGQIWGSFGGDYLTIGRTSGNNFNIYASVNSSSGSMQFRYNDTVLSQMNNSSITLGQTDSLYYNTYIDTYALKFRKGTTVLSQIDSNGMLLNDGNGTSLASFLTNGISFADSVPFTIGNNSSYIKWLQENGTWKIKIAADEIQMGSSDLLARDDVSLTRLSDGVRINMGDDSETVYDGTDGIDVTSQYVTMISNQGVSVHLANDTSNYALVNANGLSVYKYFSNISTTKQVAQFGETATIGRTDAGHVIVSNSNANRYPGMDFYLGTSYYGSINLSAVSAVHNLEMTGVNEGGVVAVSPTGAYIYGVDNASVSSPSSVTIHAGTVIDLEGYTRLKVVRGPTSSYSPNVWRRTNSLGSGEGELVEVTNSSRRYKDNIEPLTDITIDHHKLYDLRVVQFTYKDGYLEDGDMRAHKLVPGFIAEEVYEAYPIAADFRNDLPDDWNVKYVVPPMLKLIQEHKAKLDELEAEINQLKGAS